MRKIPKNYREDRISRKCLLNEQAYTGREGSTGCNMLMKGTPAHLPFAFVHFGGHACKSPGHAGNTICGRYLYKITLKSPNDTTWLNCKEHVYQISGLPGNAIKIHIAISTVIVTTKPGSWLYYRPLPFYSVVVFHLNEIVTGNYVNRASIFTQFLCAAVSMFRWFVFRFLSFLCVFLLLQLRSLYGMLNNWRRCMFWSPGGDIRFRCHLAIDSCNWEICDFHANFGGTKSKSNWK